MTKFTTLESKKKEKKETVFTHVLDKYKNIQKSIAETKDFDNVLHIGYDECYGDVFKCWDDDDIDEFMICLGTKGDEFND